MSQCESSCVHEIDIPRRPRHPHGTIFTMYKNEEVYANATFRYLDLYSIVLRCFSPHTSTSPKRSKPRVNAAIQDSL